MTPDEPILIDANEAAKLLGISVSSWWRLHAFKGAPLKLKICRMSRWRRQEVVDWVVAGMPGTKAWKWVQRNQ
jgi:predicted DNA-binding transcriptional regulator AlpA